MAQSFSHVMRSLGRRMETWGVALQESLAVVETLNPSTRVVSVQGKQLEHGIQAFVAPTASVAGEVAIGEMSSVWYGASVRGDSGKVTVGRNSAVQDCATVAGTKEFATVIGDEVVVAPGAVVRGATIGDGTTVGMGATVSPGARIGKDCYIDAGAVVPGEAVVPAGSLWTGNPGAKVRDLTADEMSFLRSSAVAYAELSQTHFDETEKTMAEREADVATHKLRLERGIAPEEEIPTVDPAIEHYYHLSTDPVDQGIFRVKNYDDSEIRAKRYAEEVAADLEDDAVYDELARLERVAAGVRELAGIHPKLVAERQAVMKAVSDFDPAAGKLLKDIVDKVDNASEDGLAALAEEIASLDPTLAKQGDSAHDVARLKST